MLTIYHHHHHWEQKQICVKDTCTEPVERCADDNLIANRQDMSTQATPPNVLSACGCCFDDSPSFIRASISTVVARQNRNQFRAIYFILTLKRRRRKDHIGYHSHNLSRFFPRLQLFHVHSQRFPKFQKLKQWNIKKMMDCNYQQTVIVHNTLKDKMSLSLSCSRALALSLSITQLGTSTRSSWLGLCALLYSSYPRAIIVDSHS